MEHISSNKISLCFIQETWITDSNNHTTATVKAYGYKMHHYHRKDSTGVGVAIIYKPTIKLIRVFVNHANTFESVCVKIMLPDNKSLLCCCIYRTGAVSTFFSDFDDFIGDIFVRYNKFLICGDVNLHLDLVSAHTTEFLRIISSYGLHQHVMGATHKAGHTLDVVISSNKVVDKDEVNIQPQTSNFPSCDHFPLNFSTNCEILPAEDKKKITLRNTKRIDLQKYRNVISHGLAAGSSTSSFKDKINHYNTVCTAALDEQAPILTKWIRELNSAPWFDSEYKEARKMRRKAEKQMFKSGLDIDRDIYNHLRIHCNELAKSKKIHFYKSQFVKYNHSQKSLYQFVDTFLDKDNELTLPPAESLQQTVDDFNTFFTEKVKKIRKSFPLSPPTTLNTEAHTGTKLAYFEPTTVEEVAEILKDTNIKSCGLDPVPAELLKENLDLFLPELCDLVNLSLTSGSMEGVKVAHLTPLIKSMSLDSSNMKNYRPVSNLAFVGKLIEKVVQRRLEKHLTANGLHIPSQSAYKKNHSTETLLIRVVNDLLIASDQHKATVVLLLDLSAAFDTVDHNKLLSILEAEIGIVGLALKWFKSYLSGRCQRVHIGDSESPEIIIMFGVPQGSVLGPILFNIYIRSLYRTVKSLSFMIHGFADDHQVYKSFKPTDEYTVMVNDIPSCFSQINEWMAEHFLQLNAGKTEIIVFGSSSVLSKLQIKGIFITPSVCIRLVSTAKNLGFYLDSSLDFCNQVKKLKSSCFLKLRNIAKMKSFLTVDQMQQLVQALILSSIDYCNALYFGSNSSVLRQLQSIQNRACKTVFGLKRRDSVDTHLQSLHWLRVAERIEFKILLVTYKSLNGLAPSYLSELFSYNPISGSRTPSLQPYLAKTSNGDRAFISCASKLWNNLPCDIKHSSNINIFKRALKTFLFRKSFNL